MKSKLVLAVFAVLIAGCAASYKQSPLASPIGRLSSSAPVLIATPSNGFYESDEYVNSGRMTANAVRAAFAKHASRTTISGECRDVPCLQAQNPEGTGYLVVPEILHWEDRATEWSGKPDRLEVKLSTFEARSGRELGAVIITGKSKWATFGGDHPQDLLPEPLTDYVNSLY